MLLPYAFRSKLFQRPACDAGFTVSTFVVLLFRTMLFRTMLFRTMCYKRSIVLFL